jgi:hypothetical protein
VSSGRRELTVTAPNLTTLEGTALTSTNMKGKSLQRHRSTQPLLSAEEGGIGTISSLYEGWTTGHAMGVVWCEVRVLVRGGNAGAGRWFPAWRPAQRRPRGAKASLS